MYYIGIDLGTSSAKGILTDRSGAILREASAFYEVSYPHDGWSEQDPADWLKALKALLAELSADVSDKVEGISFGGQMHGLVLLDEHDAVIRPAILWNDGRTERETAYLNEVIGRKKLSERTANIAFAGFTAPKLLWVKEHEPENFSRIKKIMLPKDYLVWKLTGVHATDYSDASGTLLLDVKNKRWNADMVAACSVKEAWLPRLYESFAPVGKVRPEFGLKNAVVAAGAGDNAAAAIGTGTVKGGDTNISLGTSGTVFIAQDTFSVDPDNALHSFAHANGRWHLMGCILSAASANSWWLERILKTNDYEGAVAGQERLLGENQVFFLPYLMGERSPHNDVLARGAFLGMRPDTTREQMSLAVLEGVAFALRDCVEIAKKSGVRVNATNLCGGGARSGLWRKIIANVLDADVYLTKTEKGPAFGAAMLAMVASGAYATVEDAAKAIVVSRYAIGPEPALVEKYNDRYAVYRSLYPALKPSFAAMRVK